MNSARHDEAVSPVIGVILMVAITVILAAMIASIVMGMTTNIQHLKVVTAKVSQLDESTIIAIYYGGTDEKTCVGIRWDIQDSYGVTQSHPMGIIDTPSTSQLLVGSQFPITGNFGGKDHVVATAYFMDGTQQVILDAFI